MQILQSCIRAVKVNQVSKVQKEGERKETDIQYAQHNTVC